MDHLINDFNIILPLDIKHGVSEKINNIKEIKLYREESIIAALKKFLLEGNKVDLILFVGDALDLPGRYTFPIIKNRIIHELNYPADKMLDLITNSQNQESNYYRITNKLNC